MATEAVQDELKAVKAIEHMMGEDRASKIVGLSRALARYMVVRLDLRKALESENVDAKEVDSLLALVDRSSDLLPRSLQAS